MFVFQQKGEVDRKGGHFEVLLVGGLSMNLAFREWKSTGSLLSFPFFLGRPGIVREL
jgi:hypothetical protein